MPELDARLSRAVTVQAMVSSIVTLLHSLRARGLRRTLLFAVLGVGLPVVGEGMAVYGLRVLRHHLQPQVAGVPVAAVVGWYNIGYATFAIVESLLAPYARAPRTRRWLLPLLTALTATSLDALSDCYGLDLGLWEWRDGGPYARDMVGPNGQPGIPLLNFAGWVQLTGGVTALHLRWEGAPDDAAARPGAAGSREAGRTATLLLLPYYGAAAGWALRRRKWRYLLASALVPVAMVWAWWGRLEK